MTSTHRNPVRVSAMLFAGTLGVLSSSAATATPPCPEGQDDHRIIAEEVTTVAGDLVRTAQVVQVGPRAIDRFEVVHVAAAGTHHARGALLLIPPISSGFSNYEVDERGGYEGSFAAFFAHEGYDVWGLSQRTQFLRAGTCESGADCSAMLDWGLQTLLDDATWVRGQILASGRTHAKSPVVGGLSLGSIATFALLDQHPRDYDGAILLEGTIYDTDPATRAITADFCAQFSGALAAGVAWDGQQLGGMKLVAALAASDPSGPSPLPGLPPGMTNHQAFVAVMSNPGISPLTPRPGYQFLAGDPITDSLTYANGTLATYNIGEFVDYVALATVRDIECSLAGDRTFSGNLADYHGPAFVAGGGHGFGPGMLDALALMTHAHAEVHYEPSFGHMDHYFATDHVERLERPILRWLERQVWHR